MNKNWKHGTFAAGKPVTANYYNMNGIEYRASVK